MADELELDAPPTKFKNKQEIAAYDAIGTAAPVIDEEIRMSRGGGGSGCHLSLSLFAWFQIDENEPRSTGGTEAGIRRPPPAEGPRFGIRR